jgi:hypothetical protein
MTQNQYDKLAIVLDDVKEKAVVTIDKEASWQEVEDVSQLVQKHFSIHEADAITRGIFDCATTREQMWLLLHIIHYLSEHDEENETNTMLKTWIDEFAS